MFVSYVQKFTSTWKYVQTVHTMSKLPNFSNKDFLINFHMLIVFVYWRSFVEKLLVSSTQAPNFEAIKLRTELKGTKANSWLRIP